MTKLNLIELRALIRACRREPTALLLTQRGAVHRARRADWHYTISAARHEGDWRNFVAR